MPHELQNLNNKIAKHMELRKKTWDLTSIDIGFEAIRHLLQRQQQLLALLPLPEEFETFVLTTTF